MSPAKRTRILGATAAAVIGLLGIDQLLGGAGPASAPAASAPRSERGARVAVTAPEGPLTGLPSGAAPGAADLAALRERYQPILTARPFAVRSFAPKSQAPARVERAPSDAPALPPGPSNVQVWLTSFLGHGATRAAVLEERGTGKGFVLQAGATVGALGVASVGTSSVVLSEGEAERTLALGASLELPPSSRDSLQVLRPVRQASAKPVTSRTDLPQLSDDKRQSILERLRARRQASLQPDEKPE